MDFIELIKYAIQELSTSLGGISNYPKCDTDYIYGRSGWKPY